MTQRSGHVQVKMHGLQSVLCDSKGHATASRLRFFLLVCLFVFVFDFTFEFCYYFVGAGFTRANHRTDGMGRWVGPGWICRIQKVSIKIDEKKKYPLRWFETWG